MRDRTGITQVVLDKEVSAEAHAKAEAARPEYVVAAKGRVRLRGAGLANPNMATGEIEVVATELLLLNEAKTPPFSPAEEAIANEEVRLKYRYIDLRRVEMQRNFKLRHDVARAIRNYLSDAGSNLGLASSWFHPWMFRCACVAQDGCFFDLFLSCQRLLHA